MAKKNRSGSPKKTGSGSPKKNANLYTAKTYQRFTLTDITRMSDKQMRSLYTKYRGIAVKRLGQFEKKGYTDTAVYQTTKQATAKLKTLDSAIDVAKNLVQLSRFLSDKQTGTVNQFIETEQRTMERLKHEGITINTHEELVRYGALMEKLRALNLEYSRYAESLGYVKSGLKSDADEQKSMKRLEALAKRMNDYDDEYSEADVY